MDAILKGHPAVAPGAAEMEQEKKLENSHRQRDEGIGHQGAAVALDYALESPDEVRGLVICSAGAAFSFSDGFLENARLVTEGKRRRDFDPKAFAEGADPGVMRQAFMAGMKTDPRATYGDLLACAEWQRQDDLSRIEAATLVVHGDAEREEVIAEADRLVESLPNASKAVVAQAGQMILYEQPDALASEISAFLGTLS